MRIAFIVFTFIWYVHGSELCAQHPAREKIDHLKAILPSAGGRLQVDYLNQLSEEYWWPPKVMPDSIECWARPAYAQSVRIHYPAGLAFARMHLGVADIYRKNFVSAQRNLDTSLLEFQELKEEKGMAWAHLWLGQSYYGQGDFEQALQNYRLSTGMLEKRGDWEGLGKAWAWVGYIHAMLGNYDSSFEYSSKSLWIRKKMSDDVCIANSLANMGNLYKVAGDYEDALIYYREGVNYASAHGIDFNATNWNSVYEQIGILYNLLKNTDSSMYYLQKALQIDPENQMTIAGIGETMLLKNEYDSALKIFLKPLGKYRSENDRYDLIRLDLDAAKAYIGMKNEAPALPLLYEGLHLSLEAKLRQSVLEAHRLLSITYLKLGKTDSAYDQLKQYYLLKDTVMNQQFLWRLTNYKKQSEYAKQQEQLLLLDKNSKVREADLKQANLTKWILAVILLATSLLGIILYRNLSLKKRNERLYMEKLSQASRLGQLEKENIKEEFQRKTVELEMKVLRAQMNPHFIFNSLNSINRFILKNERHQASEYLSKFSRLVRMILYNSQFPMITIENELDSLRLYIELEALRFNNYFTYKISVPDQMDISLMQIPPLLLQPFVENAIWHGLMPKDESGKLDIELSEEQGHVFIKITDNGVGRKITAKKDFQVQQINHPMGLKITTDRILLLRKFKWSEDSVNIRDLVDNEGKPAGTEVTIKIQINYG